MQDLDLSLALDTAKKAARVGREVLLDHFGRLKKVQEKAQAGLVSEADTESEKAIIRELKAGLPDVVVLGEEESFERQEYSVQPTSWVVDPLDGTTNYIHSFPI